MKVGEDNYSSDVLEETGGEEPRAQWTGGLRCRNTFPLQPETR